jgi:hypothetical protein
MTGPLTGTFADEADRRLADDDRLLATATGQRARATGGDARQPVHTVYVPADRFTATTVETWRDDALRAAETIGGLPALAEQVGVAPAVADRVAAKLAGDPIEDLRVDFEDGYGIRDDHTEDDGARTAAADVADAGDSGTAPATIGIRFKSLEAPSRRRGLATLELFLLALAEAGPLPPGLILTLPKVTTPEQISVMDDACGRLEVALDLPPGRLRLEVQIETPEVILGPDGSCPVPEIIRRGHGRVTALHYGTYDYADALHIAPEYQSMEHPAADHAKAVIQVAAAASHVWLSDGSTNILPVGEAEQRRRAWMLHALLVRRSLQRGFYQGWDLHPAQLPTRFLATYAFYREGFGAAARRLKNYAHRSQSEILDEPATVRALARFVRRGLACGALDTTEVAQAGITVADVDALARPDRPAAES